VGAIIVHERSLDRDTLIVGKNLDTKARGNSGIPVVDLALRLLFSQKMMNGTARIGSIGLAACLVIGAFLQPVRGAETYVTRTNWVEKSITNLVEVRITTNVFVNEYWTNLVEHVHTNVVIREVPRKVVVDFVHTNVITHYSTNYINKSEERMVYVDVISTNFVDVFRTNMKVLRLTNDIAVNLVKTNFVDRYRTNWQTLSFTNFQSVVVMKTNWVTQPVTNVVEIELPAKPAASSSAVSSPVSTSKPERQSAKPIANTVDGPILEGTKIGNHPGNNFVEVLLRVRSPGETADAPIQQWRIEREDGAFMSVGQEKTFRKELAPGSYKVEARLKSDGAAQVVRGMLVITGNEVVVRQKATGKRLASVGN
jgi:hypothetical protein